MPYSCSAVLHLQLANVRIDQINSSAGILAEEDVVSAVWLYATVSIPNRRTDTSEQEVGFHNEPEVSQSVEKGSGMPVSTHKEPVL